MKIWEEVSYEYEDNFWWKDDPTCGFAFPCNEAGEVKAEGTTWEKNYRYCLSHREEFNEEKTTRKIVSKYGKCDTCGKIVPVYGDRYGELRCPHCDQLYNVFGQQLASSAWDELDYDY